MVKRFDHPLHFGYDIMLWLVIAKRKGQEEDSDYLFRGSKTPPRGGTTQQIITQKYPVNGVDTQSVNGVVGRAGGGSRVGVCGGTAHGVYNIYVDMEFRVSI